MNTHDKSSAAGQGQNFFDVPTCIGCHALAREIAAFTPMTLIVAGRFGKTLSVTLGQTRPAVYCAAREEDVIMKTFPSFSCIYF
jgi:hypothetical protein